jgi:hypothetical protein
MNPQQNVSQRLYEPWQVGDDFRRWQSLGKPLRFGQWFMNDHNIIGHSELWNETDSKKAKEYILRMTL